ncbi:SIMPL domain-containing protein [Ramlibacter alkalitolerans]|uniref:SIMPL domain-containing protein n=1 Tax=Ramlibacter alkalitolerans TaxID=2039631 RepID=A0ABS1JKT5_9BURK|nr:SIMPL domain-containing protein [Ramlibacter alkalitolerans]MBL0424531.1 SIMPL domain-containing protein [Ramlibacter alkalitolerans]
MKRFPRLLAAGALALAAAGACAQTLPPPQNVLQLQAAGTVEVQQDLLMMTLTTARDGADPAAVQAQLKTALDAALTEAKRNAQPGQLDVRTGNFALYPRHSRDGKISGWTGTAELILEGRDFARITQTAGRINTMTLGGVSFGLSREQRSKVEGEAQAQAIERFKARAIELARGFGFTGYTLREVAVNANEPGFAPRMRMMAQEARVAAAEAPVPVEPGRSAVTVTVSGSVQLR